MFTSDLDPGSINSRMTASESEFSLAGSSTDFALRTLSTAYSHQQINDIISVYI